MRWMMSLCTCTMDTSANIARRLPPFEIACKRLFGLYLNPLSIAQLAIWIREVKLNLSLIEAAEGDTYAPVHWSHPLRPGNLLRFLEGNCGFDRPLQHDQRFAAQFQDTQAVLSLSSLCSGCHQPIDNI